MSLRFSTCTKRKRLENENASQKLQTVQCCIIFLCSLSLSFMFILPFLRTCRAVGEQPASHPPFPVFNFHHLTYSFECKILSALFSSELDSVNLLVNKKLLFAVHPESHPSCYFRSCTYLSHYPAFV
jgi:hypothetical protein